MALDWPPLDWAPVFIRKAKDRDLLFRTSDFIGYNDLIDRRGVSCFTHLYFDWSEMM